MVIFCWGALLFPNKIDGVAATVQGDAILKSQVCEGVRFVVASQNINTYNNEAELEILYEEVLVFATSTCFFLYVIFIYKFKKEYSFLFKLFILIIPVIFIFYQYSFLPEYFRSIGRDSLIEVKNPEFAEVILNSKN